MGVGEGPGSPAASWIAAASASAAGSGSLSRCFRRRHVIVVGPLGGKLHPDAIGDTLDAAVPVQRQGHEHDAGSEDEHRQAARADKEFFTQNQIPEFRFSPAGF